MKRSNKAVTEIVGTILLLQISIALFGILYFSVLTLDSNPIKPSVNLICTIEGNDLIFEHRGGKNLDLDTEFIIDIDGTENIFLANDYLDDEGKKNGVWDIGENVVYPANNLNNLYVHVTIIDSNSNAAILLGVIQEG